MIENVTKQQGTIDITVKGLDRRLWLSFKADCKRKGLTIKGGMHSLLRANVEAK